MEEVKYIMVTSWNYHWDKLEAKFKNSTLFTEHFIHDKNLANGFWENETTTLFIKKNGDLVEQAWIGKASNFRNDNYKDKKAVRFDVSELKTVECPEKYRKTGLGWHISPTSNSTFSSTIQSLEPTFFREMEICDYSKFEEYSYYLLKLLGIHDIHKFPPQEQSGKADGFFKFDTLAVFYDATLNRKYLETKQTQIQNYINQLKEDKYKNGLSSTTIKDATKQIWIITRGKDVKIISEEDGIYIKEIPYTKLIDIFYKRLDMNFRGVELLGCLKNIG